MGQFSTPIDTDLSVQALDGVRGVQDFAHLRREGGKRDHLLPTPVPTVYHGCVAFPVWVGFDRDR